jgi:integrase
MKLTVNSVAALKLPKGKDGDQTIFDDTIAGFGIRLRPGGAYWVFQYAIVGKDLAGERHRVQRKITFGTYPAMSVPKARAQAEELHAAVKLGRDPAGEKAMAQAKVGETVGACINIYLERRRKEAKLRPVSFVEIERHLSRSLRALHSLPINGLTRRAIAIELARITGERGPIESNRTRTSLVKFLNWAAGEGFVDSNVAQFTNKNPETARTRLLVDAELRKILHALPDGDYADIVRLLALTLARRSEIALLQWREIDFERGQIVIPPERTKTRKPNTIPMSATVRAILEARSQQDGRSYVFGRGRGFSGWSRCKIELDKAVKLEGFSLHDLRRAGATGLANLGVQPFVIEALLNHTSGTRSRVTARYNLSEYAAEKASALAVWDQHLTDVVAGRTPKISSFKRA